MQVLEACARKGVRVQVPPEPLPPFCTHSGRYHASTAISAHENATNATDTHNDGGTVGPRTWSPAASYGHQQFAAGHGHGPADQSHAVAGAGHAHRTAAGARLIAHQFRLPEPLAPPHR